VYLAHERMGDRVDGRPLAIKAALMDGACVTDEAHLHALVQRVPSDCIVPLRAAIFAPQDPEKVVGLVTDYCAAGSLETWLRFHSFTHPSEPHTMVGRSRMPWHARLELAEQILSGLDHIHRSGVAHLDIKPANILMRSPLEDKVDVVIADFGMGDLLDGMYMEGQYRGTLPYMPPEMLRQPQTIPHPSQDVWSFGVLLLDLVRETPAGFGMTNEETRRALVDGSLYSDLSDVQCEPEYLSLVRACLKDNPDERATVSTLLEFVLQMRQLTWSVVLGRGTFYSSCTFRGYTDIFYATYMNGWPLCRPV
jgi:serine/threonine protein kinase